VSPKWRLCVFANAEEEEESNSSSNNTNTNTKDDERGGEFLGDSLKTQGSRRDKNKLLLLRLSEGVESGVKV